MELSSLTQKRQNHVDSCRDNNDTSHEIIANLYSDSSHFIYEILQNADDAKASEVEFKLTSEKLSITHNGKPFIFEDVESITTVGFSAKADDVNTIGKFGIGFKSVFAITKKPCIHSGEANFEIRDFIVPKEIDSINIEPEITKIILPFNDPENDNSYKQISEHLQKLKSESLLFLRNIKKIKWNTDTDSNYYLVEINGNKANLISKNTGEKKYFLCKKTIEIEKTELEIVVAYLLKDEVIAPVNDSKLFVFFPTKEATDLKFLVHAPYKTTPSRETIPFHDTQNQQITKALASLIAQGVIILKNEKLLTVNVLSMLPIDSEHSHPIYSEAFAQVKSILEKEALLPTKTGTYEKAGNVILAREKELTKLLKITDCKALFKRERWLSTDITSNKTAELRSYLTDKLNISEITMQKFCKAITKKFIKSKSDGWLVKFYSSLVGNESLYRKDIWEKGILRERPIIRLKNNKNVNPENESGDLQVYLPVIGKSRFKTVKETLLKNKEAKQFLEKLGLKKPDSITEIKQFIIPKYQGNIIELNKYTKDFERVLEIWSQSDEYRKTEIVDLLKESKFVRCVTENRSISYQVPKQVYFPTEKLSAWFDKNSCDDIFFLDLSIKLSEQKRKFIESLGVKYELKTSGASNVKVNSYGRYERSVNGFNPNFDIHGLEYSLNNITIERSILLWAILINNTNKLKGHIETRTNQNYPYNKGELKTSQAMGLLNNHAWLYNKTGELFNVQIGQITLGDLNDKYLKENENIEKLVKILGLKLDEILAFEEKTGKKVVSQEDYEWFLELKKKHDEKKECEADGWYPEVNPNDVKPTIVHFDLLEPESQDLSVQGAGEGPTDRDQENNDHEENGDNNESSFPKNSKAIGDWGEEVAEKYLRDKYPNNDVINLNKYGTGKGYDFIIKDNNGKKIAYYEVKSKTDESPTLFQVSGTQWNWAKKLHSSKKGDMYRILVISNVGTKKPKIGEIKNPVGCWESGKLYADPVNIKL